MDSGGAKFLELQKKHRVMSVWLMILCFFYSDFRGAVTFLPMCISCAVSIDFNERDRYTKAKE